MDPDTVPVAGIDPLLCPLCGRPNECGAARGEFNCWCWNVTIPQEVLDRVPVEARGVSLCVSVVRRRAERGRPAGSADRVNRGVGPAG